MEMNGKTVTKLSSSPAAIMVSKVLRFLPAAGKAGVLQRATPVWRAGST